jgi:membrane-associated phospholipid phosphatase
MPMLKAAPDPLRRDIFGEFVVDRTFNLRAADDRHASWLWWQCIAVAAILTLAFAPWDVAISRTLFVSHPTGPTNAMLRAAEKLGNGGTVIAIVIGLAFLDRRIWSRWPQLLSASLGAGLIADGLKLCIDRGRPYSLDLPTATFTSTFHGWFPLLSTKAAEQGFPSGHATTAAGFAVALALLYPRGRWLFACAVAAVMSQRVLVHAHFPTDVMAGAILGAVWARQCHRGKIGAMFGTLQQKIELLIGPKHIVVVPPNARRGWRSLETEPQMSSEMPESTPRRRSA